MGKINLLGKELVINDGIERSNEVRSIYFEYASQCKKKFIDEYRLTYKSIREVCDGVIDLGLRMIDEGVDKAVKYLIEKMVYTVDSDTFFGEYYAKYNTWEENCNTIISELNEILAKELDTDKLQGIFENPKYIQAFAENIYCAIFDMNMALIAALSENSDENYKYVSDKDIAKTQAIYNNMSIIPDKEGALFQIIQLNPYDKTVYMFALQHGIGDKQEIIDTAHFFFVDISENFNNELKDIYNEVDKSSEESILSVKEKLQFLMGKYYIDKSEYLNKIEEDWNEFDKKARTYKDKVYATREEKEKACKDEDTLKVKFENIEELSLEALKELLLEINKEDYDEEIKASYLEKLQLQIQESQMARLCDSYKEKSLVELTVILGKIVASNFDFEIVSKYYKIIKDRIVDLKLNEKYWIYDKYVSDLEYISKGKAKLQAVYEENKANPNDFIEYSKNEKLIKMNEECSESFSEFDGKSAEIIFLNYNDIFMITDDSIYFEDSKIELQNVVDIYGGSSDIINITSINQKDLQIKIHGNIAQKLSENILNMIRDILSGFKYLPSELYDINLDVLSQNEIERAISEKADLAAKCKNMDKYSVSGLKVLEEEISKHNYLEAIKELFIKKIQDRTNYLVLEEKCKDIERMTLEELVALDGQIKEFECNNNIKEGYLNKIEFYIQKIKSHDTIDLITKFNRQNRKYISDKLYINNGNEKFINIFNKCVKTEIYSKKYEVPLMLLIYNNNFIAITDKTIYCNDKSIEIKNIKKIVGEKLLFIGSIIIEADDSTKLSIQSDKNTVQKDAELLNNFVKLLLE